MNNNIVYIDESGILSDLKNKNIKTYKIKIPD